MADSDTLFWVPRALERAPEGAAHSGAAADHSGAGRLLQERPGRARETVSAGPFSAGHGTVGFGGRGKTNGRESSAICRFHRVADFFSSFRRKSN